MKQASPMHMAALPRAKLAPTAPATAGGAKANKSPSWFMLARTDAMTAASCFAYNPWNSARI